MPKIARELSDRAVKQLKEPGLHPVGGVPGLRLQVIVPERGSAPTSRTWILRVSVGGKRREMGLGSYPEVALAAARDRAREARQKIDGGVDPIFARREHKSALRAEAQSSITFSECATKYIEAKGAEWRNAKHRQQWENTLVTYANPVIGRMLVRDIQLPHVLRILEPIWKKKTETATRLRGRIESVLDWATVRQYRSGENPARWKGHLDTVLPTPSKVSKVEHHEALTIDDTPVFVAALRQKQGNGARALELLVYTATRSGEVRGARWSEFDLEKAEWTIPAERMKAGKEHRVPLSRPALQLLEAMPRAEGDALVFPNSKGLVLSDMTLTKVMRDMAADGVPHGFRSTFRDWASERTNYPRDVCEMALAHTIGDKVEAAYRRGELLEKRRALMADWAAFCTSPAGN